MPGRVEHVAAAVSIAASVTIFLLTRFASWDPETLLDLGLVYEAREMGSYRLSDLRQRVVAKRSQVPVRSP